MANIPRLERKVLLEEKRSTENALKKEMTAARLGYAVVNLLDPGVTLVFGEYNNRAQNSRAVADLVQGYRSMGIQHEQHPMPVAVRADWIESGCLVAMADDQKIKDVQWTSKAEGGQVTVLGGQHRRAAVLQYKDELEAESAKLRATIATRQKKLAATGGDEGDGKGKGKSTTKKDAEGTMRAQLADMEDLLESINKILGELGKWTIEVYDIGECEEYVFHWRSAIGC